jgi:hypothetical protein
MKKGLVYKVNVLILSKHFSIIAHITFYGRVAKVTQAFQSKQPAGGASVENTQFFVYTGTVEPPVAWGSSIITLNERLVLASVSMFPYIVNT